MGVTWTAEQKQVIDVRNRNILVSAAAGSGKTAVLVERIIKMITEEKHPVDIDKLLVVTFTNAAAAEMRERISNAIEKTLSKNPNNEHLQRQLSLIHNAQITTIDSFCLYVIRNHFHEIDLEPNFRIGDEGELKLLREDVLKKVLERNYEERTAEFEALVEGYASGKSDIRLREMILALYEFSQSYPWPEEWLLSCVKGYQVEDKAALDEAEWIKPVTGHIRCVTAELCEMIGQAYQYTQDADGPDVYENVLRDDLEKHKTLASCTCFTEFADALKNLKYGRLPSSRGYEGDPQKLERVKELRNEVKDAVKKLNSQYFYVSLDVMIEQMKQTKPMAEELVRLAMEFLYAFSQEKRRKNMVDFHDLEHFALQILVDSETKKARKTAEEFRDNFEEIMIDEYQDSNHVQEAILTSVSRTGRGQNNIFMVGDVKQSIYRFRLARPELFMEKYDTYDIVCPQNDNRENNVISDKTRQIGRNPNGKILSDGAEEINQMREGSLDITHQKIELHKNFRSRMEVLQCTNDIFYKIMAKDLGGVAYDEAAALYYGAGYETNAVFETEKDKAASDCKTAQEYKEKEPVQAMFAPEIWLADSSDEMFADSEQEDKKQLEARMVAGRIKRLMEEQYVTEIKKDGDKETQCLRKVRYSDIVILLRSLNGWADTFASVLKDAGIPAHTVSSTGYFTAVEVQTVLAMLKILDNPRQDIPLAAVLRSPIVGLTDEELAMLRLVDRKASFHVCVLRYCEMLMQNTGEEVCAAGVGNENGIADMPKEWTEKLEKKMYHFYQMYQHLRSLVSDTPIHDLLEIVLKETGYGNYAAAMPAGKRRQANLRMLVEKAIAYENTSYKGLFHFVRYIDELQKYDVDFGEADTVGENEDVVRIMSIHKSKGLEFPVVFVSGLGKNFNRQDTRNRMVLHPDYGMGLDYMDGKRRIKSPTVIKRSIAKKMELENLGEELRVLYVALTRAKEKLILTGIRKDAEENLVHIRRKAGEDSRGAERKVQPLSYRTREGAAGYFDWILPALCSYGDSSVSAIYIADAADLVVEEIKMQTGQAVCQEQCLDAIKNADPMLVEDIQEKFAFRYPYEASLARKNKYSVSELKHRMMQEYIEHEQEEIEQIYKKEEIVPYIPLFVRKKEQMEEENQGGVLHGTAVHRVMECYQFASDLTAAQQIRNMAADGKLTEEMRRLIRVSVIDSFVKSAVGIRMKKAEANGKLYRENPFVMGFTGAELLAFGFGEETAENSFEKEELTLIQGIIDVFWIEDDGIVLLDYKTDRVEAEQELVERYASQLQMYGEVLERIYGNKGLKVKERLIYSFRLGTVISV